MVRYNRLKGDSTPLLFEVLDLREVWKNILIPKEFISC